MAEWLPKYLPGQRMTATASATITGGQLIAVSGDGTVGPAGANSIAVVGVAGHDAASTEKLTYYVPKVGVVTASGAITAGAKVVAAAAGAVSALAVVTTPTAADVTNTRAIIGVALTTAASNLVKVQFSGI